MKLFSLIESPSHPYLSPWYASLGITEERFDSTRKLNKALKKDQPDFLVAEFIYGYGNNYAGVNVCNLDVTLYAMQRFSPDTKVIVFTRKEELQYIDKLTALFPIHAVITLPANERAMRDALNQ